MHLCNLARCQHSKGVVFIKFWGRNKRDDHSFFLVDANMQASQNYGTTTGTAARVLRPSTEYQWSLLALPAPALKIFTIIITKSIFSWTSLYNFQAPLKVSVYWQMREVAHAERGVQNVQVVQTSSENTFKPSSSASLPESDHNHHPRIPENDCKICNFCNKKWAKTKLTFLYFPGKFASCANTSWENTAALCVNPNPLVNSPSVHKLVFGKTKTSQLAKCKKEEILWLDGRSLNMPR